MKTEYEATFRNVNKDEIRGRLQEIGAKLVKPEFLQRRNVFDLPEGHEISGAWVRVRDEQDRITLSLKIVQGNTNIEDQKELELKIDDFESASEILKLIGCRHKAYQENYREKWILQETEITIDEWPYLEPFVEIEGKNETEVRMVADRLGFDYTMAFFGSVDGLYAEKYNIPADRINRHTPFILFNMDRNPFCE